MASKDITVAKEAMLEELEIQTEEMEAMDQLWTRVVKEPTKRKTRQLLTNLKNEAHKLWKNFEERHEKLIKSGEVSSSSYVLDNGYQGAAEVYSKIMAKLNSDWTALGYDEAPPEQRDVKLLLRDRSGKLAVLTRVVDRYSNLDGEECCEDDVVYIIQKIHRHLLEFTKAHELIPVECEEHATLTLECDQVKSDIGDELKNWRDLKESLRSENIVIKSCGNENSELEAPNTANNTAATMLDVEKFFELLRGTVQGNSGSTQGIKLPTLEIPKFNGELRKWLAFKGAYESSIHRNNRVDAIQKLRYLQMYVVGPAKSVISHLELSELNYEVAWKLLMRRYNNKKLLINSYLEWLLSIKAARQDKANELKCVLDEFKEAVFSLKNLGEEPWNALIVHLMCSKLPIDTLTLWEQSRGREENVASWDELDDFLETRIQALVTIEAKTRCTPPRASYSVVERPQREVINSTVCVVCGADHLLYKCEGFLAKPAIDRVAIVNSAQVCAMCLNKHPNNACKFKWTCRICKGKHNSLLHVPNSTRTVVIS